MVGLVQVTRAHINLQHMFFAVARGDALFTANQFACHQRKKVAGFMVWVYPFRKMPAIFQFAFLHQISVGQKHWVGEFVSTQGHAKHRHHIGSVKKITDASEALRFALREEGILADIQAAELGIFGRVAGGENFQLERLCAFWQVFKHQLLAIYFERSALTVNEHAGQVEVFAVQTQRLCGNLWIAPYQHGVEDAGFERVQVKHQINIVDPEAGGLVVFAPSDHGLAFTKHGGILR